MPFTLKSFVNIGFFMKGGKLCKTAFCVILQIRVRRN